MTPNWICSNCKTENLAIRATCKECGAVRELHNPKLTADEQHQAQANWTFEMFQKGQTGSFFTHLFDAIQAADPFNLKKLRHAFPHEVQAFENWKLSDLPTDPIAATPAAGRENVEGKI